MTGKATVNLENPETMAQAATSYRCDTNYDHVCDDTDTLGKFTVTPLEKINGRWNDDQQKRKEPEHILDKGIDLIDDGSLSFDFIQLLDDLIA
jgi:hypothetical protein